MDRGQNGRRVVQVSFVKLVITRRLTEKTLHVSTGSVHFDIRARDLAMTDRREFLSNTILGIGGTLLTPPLSAAADELPSLGRRSPNRSPDPRFEYGDPLSEFRYGDVDFGPSLQRAQLEQTHTILMGMNEDSLLRPFRLAAGLPAPGNDLGGWYSETLTPEASGPVGPATFGQWLSALSRYFAATGDAATQLKIQRLVDGYAMSSEPQGRLFQLTDDPNYLYDKLVCGLEDAYEFAGVKSALHLISSTTDSALPHLPGRAFDQLSPEGEKNGESYTLPENQFIAWQRGAGERHLQIARQYLADDVYFAPLARGVNVLPRRHAYSHVNALCSAAKAYLVLGDEKFLQAAINGLTFVEQQSFATGGWGPNESFLPISESEYINPDTGKRQISPAIYTLGDAIERTQSHFETPCGSYAHFKLTRHLLRITKNPHYGDSMERIMYNAALGALPLNKFGKAFYHSNYHHHARKEYFDGYGNGMKDEWPCCSGTLPQLAADYRISAYFRDSKGIYVNLFIPSTLHWEQSGTRISVKQTGELPINDTMTFEITTSRPVECTVRLRIPKWTYGPTIQINGKGLSQPVQTGTFATIHRRWNSGDRIALQLPRRLELQAVDSQHPDSVALVYGPLVLFAVADDTPKVTRAQLLGAKQQSSDAAEWQVSTDSGTLRMKPFWAIKDEIYFTYLSV